ncbi:MAG: type II toxin-antitoxin system VapC family toxin [Solirubrobacteraceae bacterium]
MIFVDANVPMYLVGRPHPHKTDAQLALERLAAGRRRLVTSSEVFQEILHRYVATDRRHKIEQAFDSLRGIVDDVFPVEEHDVFLAKDLVHAHPKLSARDALHAAVMRRRQIAEIVSFDRGFDAVLGLTRLP